jgi:hypothetical protein
VIGAPSIGVWLVSNSIGCLNPVTVNVAGVKYPVTVITLPRFALVTFGRSNIAVRIASADGCPFGFMRGSIIVTVYA